MSKKAAFFIPWYFSYHILRESISFIIKTENNISTSYRCMRLLIIFFSDVNTQYPWRKKAYKYTDICITSKIHILRQSTIKLAINKCRLPIRICKDRNSRIVKILVCRWRERLIQCNRANHLFVLYVLAPNFGSQSWITNPFGLAPPINGTPLINDVGNGQQSSYQEQTYTLPGGSMSYYESSG